MNSNVKKSIVLGTIVFMILTSVSSTTGTNITPSSKVAPLGYEPTINVTIPDAYLNYHSSKLRYADVEFGEPGTTVDINISGYSSNVNLRFIHNIILEGDLPSLSTWVVHNLIVSNETNPSFVGSGMSVKIGKFDNWQYDMGFIRHDFNESDVGIYSMDITLTGIPPRLQFLFLFHTVFDVYYIDKLFPTPPFPKIVGGTVTYQLDIHT